MSFEKRIEVDSEAFISPATGGPYGIGDPDDRSLRRVERDILIPKIVREKSRKEKCAPEVAEFGKCCTESNMLSFMKCQKENEVMKDCLKTWFFNKDFVNECTEIYLEERSAYRRTGIPRKARLQRMQ